MMSTMKVRTMTSRKVTMTATMLELGSSDCQIVTLAFQLLRDLFSLLCFSYPPDILCLFSALPSFVSDWSNLTKSDLVFNPPENCRFLGGECVLVGGAATTWSQEVPLCIEAAQPPSRPHKFASNIIWPNLRCII